MKLEELFSSRLISEMPEYVDREMTTFNQRGLFMSETTIDEEFEKLAVEKVEGDIYCFLIRKTLSKAIIGKFSHRAGDGVFGVEVLAQLEFKRKLDLSWFKDIDVASNTALQVDGIQIDNPDNKRMGLGSKLYFSLANYGFVVISDNTQYVGGRKLWEKIAKNAKYEGSSVYIVDDGEVVMDEWNKPLEYDGVNYPSEEIWAAPSKQPGESKKHILLVLKKN